MVLSYPLNIPRSVVKSSLTAIASSVLLFTVLGSSNPAVAQRIVDVTPNVNSEDVAPQAAISGLFQNQGTTRVVVDSVKIEVNGQDVTARSTITANFFSYLPPQPLPVGSNRVRIEYTNTQGVRRAASWDFQVSNPVQEVVVKSVTHNATEASLAPASTLLITLTGTPGSNALAYLVQTGQPTQAIAANEVSPGVYVATWTAPQNRAGEIIVVGELEQKGVTRFAVAEKSLNITSTTVATTPGSEVLEEILDDPANEVPTEAVTNAPLQPVFTSHSEGASISNNTFLLQGRTRPNATVQVRVTAIPRRLNVGGIFSVGMGDRVVVNQTLTSNEAGVFEVSVPSSDPGGTRYVVEAIARTATETSPPQELNLVRQ